MKTEADKPSRWMPRHEFDAIYARVPRLSVDLIIRTPNGILLTKRSTDPCEGQWHIPGGTVLFGERLSEAVCRIATGEIGVKVQVGKQLGFIEYTQLAASGYPGWPVAAVFEVKVIGGRLLGSFQGREMGFFNKVPDNMIADQATFMEGII